MKRSAKGKEIDIRRLAEVLIEQAIVHQDTTVTILPGPKVSTVDCYVGGDEVAVATIPVSLHASLVEVLETMGNVDPVSVCERRHGRLEVATEDGPDYEVTVQIVEGGTYGEKIIIGTRPALSAFTREIEQVLSEKYKVESRK